MPGILVGGGPEGAPDALEPETLAAWIAEHSGVLKEAGVTADGFTLDGWRAL